MNEYLRDHPADIDDFIDECEDIEKLFEDVLKELSESNAGKMAMKMIEERVKKAERNN